MGLKTLKSKLLITVSALVIGSSLLISFLVTQRYSSSLFETMTGQAENLAHAVAIESEAKILINDLLALQKNLDLQVRNNPAISYLFVYRNDEVLAGTFKKGVPIELLNANPLNPGEQSSLQKIVSTDGERYLDIAWPIFDKKAGVLRLGLSETPYRRKLIRLWYQMGGLTLGILLLALMGSLLFIRRIMRPLEALAAAIQKVDEGNLSVRVQEKGQDEVGKLAASFNHMLGRMDEYTRKLEEQTMNLELAHQRTQTFCKIVKEVGSLQSIEKIGSLLINQFRNILKCNRMVLLIFSADRHLVCVLSSTGAKFLKESKILQAAYTVLDGHEKFFFTNKTLFKPPLVPDDFETSVRHAVIPLCHKKELLGGLYVACPGSCQCSAKEFEMVDLIMTQTAGVILRAIHQEVEMHELRARLTTKAEYGGIIGKDEKMQLIYKQIEDIAPTDVITLIQGESGTGKEVVAHAIHRKSFRHDKSFVVVNCAAYPSTLLESELFGHEKGAFTGAIRQKPGRFEQADGGTVFLDEIGEIPLPAQVKLLRVLQTQKFERVGGETTVDVDVRIIAATHKNLSDEVKKGRFREDLFYRLNVFVIQLPPLKERYNDIPLLAHHFLRQFTKEQEKKIRDFSADALRRLLDYSWPGNVRELQNCIEHSVAVAKGERVEVADLPSLFHGAVPVIGDSGLSQSLAEHEKQFIQQILTDCGGNKMQTARRLGISRNTLYLKLKKYHITYPATH